MTHSNGIGQSFYDCVPAGTYDLTQATAAANAWPVAAVSTFTAACGTGMIYCKQAAAQCACWAYSGNRVGLVRLNDVSATCYCPGLIGNPSWD